MGERVMMGKKESEREEERIPKKKNRGKERKRSATE